MTQEGLLKWSEEIAQTAAQILTQQTAGSGWKLEDISAVMSDMHSLMAAAFPPAHPLLTRWEQAKSRAASSRVASNRAVPEQWFFEEFHGIFLSARRQLAGGYLGTVADVVRAETVVECLDLADSLLADGHVIAATVIAGGALEVHLHHLCQRFAVAAPQPGSIEKYNNALGEARKAGGQSISQPDSKQVTAWGGLRNEAAHRPTSFAASKDQVKLLVDGIRDFVARHA